MGLEAVLVGRPVITIDPEPGLSNLPIAEHGLAAGIRHPSELPSKVREVLTDAALRCRLASAYKKFPADGKATERIVDEIECLHAVANRKTPD